MPKKYYAHSVEGRPESEWQELREHLLITARLAEIFAKRARPNDSAFICAARWAGLLHDLGKYQKEFQEKLEKAAKNEPTRRVVHAVYGAAAARDLGFIDVLWTVLGHHTGLHSRPELKDKVLPEHVTAATSLLRTARSDLPLLGRKPDRSVTYDPAAPLSFESALRMLFSCLIDADRSDCIRFDTKVLPRGPALEAEALLKNLLKHLACKTKIAPEGSVKESRSAVLQACLTAAESKRRIYSLCVPTGGGKTLASMAFALKRAAVNPDKVRRVFVIVPFLSIIEQSANAYREALGDEAVLEHHSGESLKVRKMSVERPRDAITENEGDSVYEVEEPEEDLLKGDLRSRSDLYKENWDHPIVVTTSVRFFESLFSNKPSDTRRLHNIANSVVILDEVQTLPKSLLAPLLSIMDELTREWGVTFVLATATQPAFETTTKETSDGRWPSGTITPIISEDLQQRLFENLQRVRVFWHGPEDTWSSARTAKEMLKEHRVLCIVNTKRHAAEIFESIRNKDSIGARHLSTRMCAAHRLNAIEEIKRLLIDTAEPCRVVSTQLVEAGVDVDFPVVMRAMAPFDSIVQAAGRCDREGRLTAKAAEPAGKLVVFEPEEKTSPYTYQTDITRVLKAGSELSIHEPQHMRAYFERLYQGELDAKNIQGLRKLLKYPEVAEAFVMIDDRTKAILVPYGKGEDLITQIEKSEYLDRNLLRQIQGYTVGLYPNEFEQAQEKGTIYRISEEYDIWGCRRSCYSMLEGLLLITPEPEDFMA